MTEQSKINEDASKRREVKRLIKSLKENYENIDINIFNSAQNVNLGTVISYQRGNEKYHFLDDYDIRRENLVKNSKNDNENEDNK